MLLHKLFPGHSMQVQGSLSLSIMLDMGLHLRADTKNFFFSSPVLKHLNIHPKRMPFGLIYKDRHFI